jgi:hypothetical protein
MALSQWSIKIVKLANGTVAFQPDLPGAQPGQPLGVLINDLITWNNTTNDPHQPEQTNPTGFLTNQIPAGQVSDPIYKAPGTAGTITYACKLHSQEQGSIVVTVS